MLTIKHFTFNPIQENTYVIYHEKGECCIVDPGCYFSNERNELKNFIARHQLTPKYLLNTHCHSKQDITSQYKSLVFAIKTNTPGRMSRGKKYLQLFVPHRDGAFFIKT